MKNNTKESSSSSTFSKPSDEEDKSSTDSHDFETGSSRSRRKESDSKVNLQVISPFNSSDFCAFLKIIFLKFLNGSDNDCKNIVLGILSFFKEENWDIFEDKDVDCI